MRVYRLLGLLLLIFLLPATRAVQAQEFTSPYSQAELDRMLAPVALYPDSVLAQMLIAATYPLEVMEAAHWSREHPDLEGDTAVTAVEDKDWAPGIKAMVAFPDVIDRMDENINWTTHLGDAFLQQEDQLMATIQSLREHALKEGHLKSTDTVRVYQEPEVIIIEPVHPRIVYVPYYDPWVVYGHWWHPHHPPYYWATPHGYHRTSVFYWGSGINFAFGFYYSNFDWHHRHVVVHKHYHDYAYFRQHRPYNYRPGKPFYKHANYKENYRHWRPEHRRQGHADKGRTDNRRHQLGGRHDRQQFERGPDWREADRHKTREHRHAQRAGRAADIRQQLRSSRHDADKQRGRAERGSDRYADGDRHSRRQQQSDRPRAERTRLQGNARDRNAVQRFRANLERHQDRSSANRAGRQQEGRANRPATSQRKQHSDSNRYSDNNRARQLRQSLADNRPSTSRSHGRSPQNRRDDGRADAWSNRSRPSFDRRPAHNQRQSHDNPIRRHEGGGDRESDRRAHQSLGNAGSAGQHTAGRSMERRRSLESSNTRSAGRSPDRRQSGAHRGRGNNAVGNGRDRH